MTQIFTITQQPPCPSAALSGMIQLPQSVPSALGNPAPGEEFPGPSTGGAGAGTPWPPAGAPLPAAPVPRSGGAVTYFGRTYEER